MEKFKYDYNLRKYVIKYKVHNHEVITYLDSDATNEQLQKWSNYHFAIIRDLVLQNLIENE